jgi:hypothetical protein
MALSNIFREPRREITETLVGLLVLGPALYMAKHMADVTGGKDAPPYVVRYIVLLLAIMAAVGITMAVCWAIHEVGESFCNYLAKHGLELRPKNRPRRNPYG